MVGATLPGRLPTHRKIDELTQRKILIQLMPIRAKVTRVVGRMPAEGTHAVPPQTNLPARTVIVAATTTTHKKAARSPTILQRTKDRITKAIRSSMALNKPCMSRRRARGIKLPAKEEVELQRLLVMEAKAPVIDRVVAEV